MSDFWHRTDRELDLIQRDEEQAAIDASLPVDPLRERIGYWLNRFKTYEQACALADTEIALARELKEAA